MKKPIYLFSCAALLNLFTGLNQSAAETFGYLKDTAAADFTKQDFALLDASLAALHLQSTVGAVEEWSNADTGNRGKVSLLGTSTENSMPCQKIRMDNESKKNKGHSTFTFCKTADNTWKILR